MPDFLGDKEEVTHSGSCANCRFGAPVMDLVACLHRDRVYFPSVLTTQVTARWMRPEDVCELWEGKE